MASPDLTELIVGALGGGGLVKLVEVLLQRRRTSAETGKIQAEAEAIHTDSEVKLSVLVEVTRGESVTKRVVRRLALDDDVGGGGGGSLSLVMYSTRLPTTM